MYRITFFGLFSVFFFVNCGRIEKAKKKDREEELGCSGHVQYELHATHYHKLYLILTIIHTLTLVDSYMN